MRKSVDNCDFLAVSLLITSDLLWITLLELCVETIQTGGEIRDFVPLSCGQFVDG
jgi:hypothetical protein